MSKSVRIRVMDIVGVVLGVCMFSYWIIVDINWIVSDIMYVAMYITIIKFIKVDSLRIVSLMFVCVVCVNLFFILFLQF